MYNVLKKVSASFKFTIDILEPYQDLLIFNLAVFYLNSPKNNVDLFRREGTR